MHYRLGVGIAFGAAVMVSSWDGRGAGTVKAVRTAAYDNASISQIAPGAPKYTGADRTAFDLGLVNVYRKRVPAVAPPVWESRALFADVGAPRLAMSQASAEVTPADRAPMFVPTSKATPHR